MGCLMQADHMDIESILIHLVSENELYWTANFSANFYVSQLF